MTLLERDEVKVRQNLFSGAHWLLDERPDFPWHRDENGQVTAAMPQSSQALALDLFATVERLDSREAIVNAWCRHLQLPEDSGWHIEPEHPVDKALLMEPRSSQLDAICWGGKRLIVWEAKFTEQDGGGCSQVKPLARGANKGKVQCSGRYAPQVNPVNGREARCALSGKGVRYWEFIPALLGVDADLDHDPCPFRGGAYQWMRNVVAAEALAQAKGGSGAFVLVHAGSGLPMQGHLGAGGSFHWIAARANAHGLSVRAVTYPELIKVARETATGPEAGVLEALDAWIEGKISSVHEQQ